jgi:hypothetical protein
MATTATTDVLHRSTLITTALLPVYNHVFIALLVESTHTAELYKEVQCFLWIKQLDGKNKTEKETSSKEKTTGRTVKGRTKFPHLDFTGRGFQQDLIQKIHKQGSANPMVNLPSILLDYLDRANRPRLPFSDKRIIPRNTEQDGTYGSSTRIPPVLWKRKTLGILFRTIYRREKTSEFRSQPFS